MKKAIVWILTLSLALCGMTALAEPVESVFDELAGLEWSFCSGVGGWSTDMRIQADGSFSGEFHDSEMGETGEDFPDGTLYGCTFSGQMVYVEEVDSNTRRIRIESLRLDEGQLDEAIEDGIRYVTCEPYGVTEGDEMLLFRPGTPVEALTEDMRMWAHILEQENPPAALETWFLYSEKNESGFVGFAWEDNSLSMINPWLDLTADELRAITGLSFGVPEGAQDVLYRFLPDDALAEMQFTLADGEYCARIKPADPEAGEMTDISGMYFDWQNIENVTIGRCPGTLGQAQADASDWVALCQWYDPASGLMYSLSVVTPELDGLDLIALAGQVYVPAQGEN